MPTPPSRRERPFTADNRSRGPTAYGLTTVTHPDEVALGSASRLLERGRYDEAA